MSGWLKDTVALVTGGGSGIGRAVTERFVAEGASVTIVGRDLDQLRTVVDECPDPSRVHAVRADVRDSEQLHHAVAETVRQYGKLDTLIANAGMWDYQRQLTKLTASQLEHAFDEVFAVNVKGYLLAAEACWRELVKTRGSIVMTLSNASFYVNGGFLEVQPQVVTVLADTAIRATDLDEAAAQAAKKDAEQALANRGDTLDVSAAQAKLAEALAQLQALERMRKMVRH